MERFEQLARAMIYVARSDHYMVGIIEKVSREELDQAEQWLISAQNKKPQGSLGYKTLDLALDYLDNFRSNLTD